MANRRRTDADRLRNAVYLLGITQREAARRLDITEQCFSCYVRRHRPIPRAILMAMALLVSVKGCDLRDLSPKYRRWDEELPDAYPDAND